MKNAEKHVRKEIKLERRCCREELGQQQNNTKIREDARKTYVEERKDYMKIKR